MGEVGNRDAQHLKFSLKTYAMPSLSYFMFEKVMPRLPPSFTTLHPSLKSVKPAARYRIARPWLFFFFFLTVSDSYYQFHQL